MLTLIIGLIVFLGIHSVRVLAPRFRENQIATGAGRWKAIYTAASLIGLLLIIWGYGEARLDNTFFYALPTWVNHIQILLMIPAMILLIASELPAGRITKAVKNPTLIAVKIWAIAHLLVNGDLASFLLFGSFLIWAVVVVIHTNRRGETFPDATSTKSDIISVVAGIGIWLAIMFWLHEWLIGVPVIA